MFLNNFIKKFNTTKNIPSFETLTDLDFGSGMSRHSISWITMTKAMSAKIGNAIGIVERTEPFDSAILRLLQYILSMIDYNYLFRNKDEIRWLSNYFYDLEDSLNIIFSSVKSGKSFVDLINFKSNKQCYNYVIPSTTLNPIKNLPIGKPWKYWKDLSPLKILSYDSDELSLNLFRDSIKFNIDSPSYIVATLNTTLLCMKYIKYRQDLTDRNVENTAETEYVFLHRYVIIPLYKDLVSLSMLKLFNLSAKGVVDNSPHTEIVKSVNGFIYKKYDYRLKIISGMEQAILEITRLFEGVKSNTIKPMDMFQLQLLPYGQPTIASYINELSVMYDIKENMQYSSAIFLRNELVYETLYNLFVLNNNRAFTKKYKNRILLQMRSIIRKKAWVYINNPFVRDSIKNRVYSLNERFLTLQ